jgi:prolyl-tRNA synthetase
MKPIGIQQASSSMLRHSGCRCNARAGTLQWPLLATGRYNRRLACHCREITQTMRLSQLPLTTLKEVPADAEVISHKLMLRAGLIRRIASGVYSWLPLGVRVLGRVQRIIREEMNRAGALEVFMPGVQPAELWQESGRWDAYGPELLRFTDRHDRSFCLGPTHEEVITDLARQELKSYKQLPVNYYQIQTKFRDEIRPRFGVMRSREFMMKDAYSFHLDEASLHAEYGTCVKPTSASSPACSCSSASCRPTPARSVAAARKSSRCWRLPARMRSPIAMPTDSPAMSRSSTCRVRRANAQHLRSRDADSHATGGLDRGTGRVPQGPAQRCLKMLLVRGTDTPAVALLLRGDHELNPVKAQRLPGVALPLTMLRGAEVEAATGCVPGFVGPKDLDSSRCSWIRPLR